jgi:membrane dipeptidase
MLKTFLLLISLPLSILADKNVAEERRLMEKARELSSKIFIIDSHIDLPFRLKNKWEDVSEHTGGHFDYPRAIKGGLNSAFLAIFVPADYEERGGSKELADSLIDMVEYIAEQNPHKFVLAKNTNDVLKFGGTDIISLPMGIENGTPIEGSIDNLKHFYERGIRYITLSHGKANHICDSSYDPERKWNGLSPFGRSLINEMNKIGMMIDVSHVSDSTFYQVLEISKAPVIATHSSCRHFTPGFERNMSDEMIKKLAENRGVIQITFGSYFISGDYQEKMSQFSKYLDEHNIGRWSDEGKRYYKKFVSENIIDFGSAELLADHIDHAVKIAGIDHVGLGSDFDGVSELPEGIEDVSSFPRIIYELLKKGYSEQEIEKICSANLLRVWKEVEDYSSKNN